VSSQYVVSSAFLSTLESRATLESAPLVALHIDGEDRAITRADTLRSAPPRPCVLGSHRAVSCIYHPDELTFLWGWRGSFSVLWRFFRAPFLSGSLSSPSSY